MKQEFRIKKVGNSYLPQVRDKAMFIGNIWKNIFPYLTEPYKSRKGFTTSESLDYYISSSDIVIYSESEALKIIEDFISFKPTEPEKLEEEIINVNIDDNQKPYIIKTQTISMFIEELNL